MNYKRAAGFGILIWVFIFVIISVLMFLPPLIGKELAIFGILWILLIPLTLMIAKWYFTKEKATAKSGLFLGLISLLVGIILDSIITIPLFVKSYSAFFGNWIMYVGYGELVILCVYAGAEFDNFGKNDEDIDKK
ncbi:MAG: hypothetical protein AAB348_00360 [Patescibacteria group bacterium]